MTDAAEMVVVAGLAAETEAAVDVRLVAAVLASFAVATVVVAVAGDVDAVDASRVVVVGVVAEPMDQRDSYHLDCYTAAQ